MMEESCEPRLGIRAGQVMLDRQAFGRWSFQVMLEKPLASPEWAGGEEGRDKLAEVVAWAR